MITGNIAGHIRNYESAIWLSLEKIKDRNGNEYLQQKEKNLLKEILKLLLVIGLTAQRSIK